jgi:hypothetical protein
VVLSLIVNASIALKAGMRDLVIGAPRKGSVVQTEGRGQSVKREFAHPKNAGKHRRPGHLRWPNGVDRIPPRPGCQRQWILSAARRNAPFTRASNYRRAASLPASVRGYHLSRENRSLDLINLTRLLGTVKADVSGLTVLLEHVRQRPTLGIGMQWNG